ncbi:hypothetical protein N8J89_01065 [Crossiella sp. CA-258035]|uniref:hypothetical protein n=1 Tax=Crossiella sp. CA-258035 TaxID=2981138 RepID=UPI0024BC7DBE|nr:hypothetical protein [Crossiella sp. CA-258035]WHT19713.1 hypothetical protein N8J89_01065 [Crossiella sp. CA-258035]
MTFPQKAEPEELARREFLAVCVRDELAAAGLAVVPRTFSGDLYPGAEVSVDPGRDEIGGVHVDWVVSPRLRACARRAVNSGRLDDPAIGYSYRVGEAMVAAMTAILREAGYTVQPSRDEYRIGELQVTAGPGPEVTPVWALTDEELRPGASPANQADSAGNPG